MATTQIWRTAGIIQETNDTITVVFDTGAMPFKYEPGQFIDVTLLINGISVTRSYSLSSSPDDDIKPSITVKKVNGGVMSNYIVNNAKDIDKWRIEGPLGNFKPSAATYASKQIVLLAGGSGITPLFSIARSILSRSPGATVTLIYSSRTPEDIIFSHSIERWAERFKSRLKSYHVLSQPGDISELSGGTVIKGRINKLIGRKLIK